MIVVFQFDFFTSSYSFYANVDDFHWPFLMMIGIQFFVDDRYENCQDVAEKTDAMVLMPHRPYNRSFNHPAVTRIHKFSEVFSHLP